MSQDILEDICHQVTNHPFFSTFLYPAPQYTYISYSFPSTFLYPTPQYIFLSYSFPSTFFTPPLNTHSFPIPFHQSYFTPTLNTSSFLIPFHQPFFTPPLNTSFFLIPFHQSYFTFPHKTSSFPIPFLCPSILLYPTPLPTLFIYPLSSFLPIFPPFYQPTHPSVRLSLILLSLLEPFTPACFLPHPSSIHWTFSFHIPFLTYPSSPNLSQPYHLTFLTSYFPDKLYCLPVSPFLKVSQQIFFMFYLFSTFN